ncbi:MAG: 50S ribosomal protein L15 [bacterium]|nr:50S ribosomal protein L15 [bacterium]
MIKLNSLESNNTPKSSRVGRGIASGRGKTAGRGTKGQKSRSGYNLPRRFEGGQSALIQRLPKIRGFKSHNIKPLALNLTKIESLYKTNETVDIESLISKGVINKLPSAGVKIIGKPLSGKHLKFEGVLLSRQLADKLSITKSHQTEKQTAKIVKSLTS